VQRAIDDYSSAVDADPTSARTLELRGNAACRLGNLSMALLDFNTALQINSMVKSVVLSRAMVYKGQDKHPRRAIQEITRLLKTYPTFTDAYFRRARLYIENNHLEEALDDFTQIIDIQKRPNAFGLQNGGGIENSAGVDNINTEFVVQDGKDGKQKSQTLLAKGMSDIMKRALLCRARLYTKIKSKINLAIEDYKKILDSDANHLEAQLEIQEAQELEEKSKVEVMNEACRWLLGRESQDQMQENEGGILILRFYLNMYSCHLT